MPFWFIPAAFAAKWAFARFAQHGGDPEATREVLAQDITKALKTGITIVKKGADISIDTARITAAVISVRNAGDFQSLVDANHALEHALSHIPAETLAGLKKSIDLEEKINAALAAGMMYSGSAMLEKAPDSNESGDAILQRIYFGLYLVGRSGENVGAENSAGCIANLVAIHNQVDDDATEIAHALSAIVVDEAHMHTAALEKHIGLTQYLPKDLSADVVSFILLGLGAAIAVPERSLHADLLHFQETR